jgi:hypothetical protein
MDDALIDLMVRRGTYWRPTLYIYQRNGRSSTEMNQFRAANFKKAVEKGSGLSMEPISEDMPGRNRRPPISR